MTAVLGNGMTTDAQLTKVGKRYLGSDYIGTFSVDVKKSTLDRLKGSKTQYYFIINVDKKYESGSHWLAIAKLKDNPKYIIYDSFARRSPRLIPAFIKTIGYKYIDINGKSDQLDHEKNCGARALSILRFIKSHGLPAAKLV